MSEDFPSQNSIFENIKIGIGTWAWGDRLFWGYGGNYHEQDIREAFQLSIASGIRFYDTAEVYGQGASETLLGKFSQEANEKIIVASKFMPYPWRLSGRALNRALKNSLKRLALSKIDLYQIHMPLPPVTIQSWMDAMSSAYQAGLIGAVGVSNYDRKQMQTAYDSLSRNGIRLASNQVEYNLLDRKIEKSGLLKQCQEMGIKVIAYSPLAQGLLTGKYSIQQPPNGIRRRRYDDAYLKKIEPLLLEIKRIGANHAGKSPAQVALNWVLYKGAIPIPGAKNAEQAQQNAEAVTWQLSEEEVIRLDQLSEEIS